MPINQIAAIEENAGKPIYQMSKWTKVGTGEVMGDDLGPASLCPEERKEYSYKGPRSSMSFGPSTVPARSRAAAIARPIMTSPVMAVKTISVKYWVHQYPHCGGKYDLEEREVRMAPGGILAFTFPPQ